MAAANLADYVECLVCMKPPQEACLCVHCKKPFCYNCISQTLRQRSVCPHCREGLTLAQVVKVPWLGEMAQNLLAREQSASAGNSGSVALRIQTLRGASFVLKQIAVNATTVLELKRKIHEHEGVRVENQVLLFRGRQMDNVKRLVDCGINGEGLVVQMTERSQGGFQSSV